MSTLQFPSTDINSRDAQIDLAEWIESYQLTEVEAAMVPGAMALASVAANTTPFQMLQHMLVDENTANMIVSLVEELEVIRDHVQSGVVM